VFSQVRWQVRQNACQDQRWAAYMSEAVQRGLRSQLAIGLSRRALARRHQPVLDQQTTYVAKRSASRRVFAGQAAASSAGLGITASSIRRSNPPTDQSKNRDHRERYRLDEGRAFDYQEAAALPLQHSELGDKDSSCCDARPRCMYGLTLRTCTRRLSQPNLGDPLPRTTTFLCMTRR
jgi:hypothetical protein